MEPILDPHSVSAGVRFIHCFLNIEELLRTQLDRDVV